MQVGRDWTSPRKEMTLSLQRRLPTLEFIYRLLCPRMKQNSGDPDGQAKHEASCAGEDG